MAYNGFSPGDDNKYGGERKDPGWQLYVNDTGIYQGDRARSGKENTGIDRIDTIMTITGTQDGSIMFDVSGKAIKLKGDRAAILQYPSPGPGAYNVTEDMAYVFVPAMNKTDILITGFNNTSVRVANASAVVSIKDPEILFKDRDYVLMEFSTMSLHLPDGSVKVLSMEHPVKVIYAQNRQTLVIDAYPTMTQELIRAFSNGMRFSREESPVKLSDLVESEMNADVINVTYVPPEIQKPPV